MRIPDAGVVARLGTLDCGLMGESPRVNGGAVDDGTGVVADGRRSRDAFLVLPGDFGESTVNSGGATGAGERATIDCGRDFGGLGRLRRGVACGSAFGLFALLRSKLLLPPTGVTGRPSLVDIVADRNGDRPTIGDAGVVPLSLSRFSNLERNDDTGLIDVSSLLFSLPSIVTSHLTVLL